MRSVTPLARCGLSPWPRGRRRHARKSAVERREERAFAACAVDMGGEPTGRGFIAAYEKLLRASGVKLSLAEEFAGVSAKSSPSRRRGRKTPPCAI